MPSRHAYMPSRHAYMRSRHALSALLLLLLAPQMLLQLARGQAVPSHTDASLTTGNATAWKFLHAYPRHYVSARIPPGEPAPSIDGRLDDPAWAAAAWTEGGFVDITHHDNHSDRCVSVLCIRLVASRGQCCVAALALLCPSAQHAAAVWFLLPHMPEHSMHSCYLCARAHIHMIHFQPLG